ncbi:exocyst complex component EXO70H1-like [Abrus precatorius]|uniref:Exocyst subunit Exo70 family protein n=1 Tax=Abrus precatorius TaxID=3816 RepID=A0A8B8L6C7_ABRPR|nr:exocyst complex component EXO70H1-like [Abrus precatorius]
MQTLYITHVHYQPSNLSLSLSLSHSNTVCSNHLLQLPSANCGSSYTSKRQIFGYFRSVANMRNLCFNPKTASFSLARNSPSSPASLTSIPTPPRLSFSNPGIVDEDSYTIEEAEALILKWNADTSAYANVTSLFYEDKTEAKQYINCVNQLQQTMHSLLSHNPSSDKLILAHNLMQLAMKRLKKEFYQILSMNRAHLDPESVSARSSRGSVHSSASDYDDDFTAEDDDIRVAGDSISEVEQVSSVAMADLKLIADCMVSSGYAKECVSVYIIIRKSIIDEGIYRLGVEKMSSSRVNKMDWEVLDLKIKSWLEAVRISVRTLFNGERILCDHVFSYSDSIRESCFAEISRDGASLLFGFPELVAKTKKSPPEKLFRMLDMYALISELWPEIESIFSSDYKAGIRSQVLASLQRLAEFVQILLMEFESTIQKDSSKLPVNGGAVHSLTVQTMNYLSILADYSNVLSDIFPRGDWLPLPKMSSLPESYLYSPESDYSASTPALTARVAWLILVLLCKLDGKAKHCKDVSLSYLFLANNLWYVVARVRSSNLQYVLGDDWITKHEAKAKRFVANYEKVAWGEVVASLPENPMPAEARAVFENFNLRFEEAYRKQNSFVIADRELRDEIKGSIARSIVPKYREWYNEVLVTVGSLRDMTAKEYVTFTPEDIENYLANLFFFGTTSSGVSSSSSVTSSPLRRWS